jgi:hypothetical protein
MKPKCCTFHSIYCESRGLYTFRALRAHPQETVGCGAVTVKLQSCQSQMTLYARNIPHAVSVAPPEDEQVMFETCRGPLILNKLN